MSQMSLWSAGAREPAVADLDGLLAGPGHIAVRDDLARIGVVVANDRVDLLVAALATDLGLTAEVVEITGETGLAVRTPWLAELRPVAAGWQHGALTLPPVRWQLDGPRLRWWCLAAGFGVEDPQSPVATYGLGLSPTNESSWPAVGAALSAAGSPVHSSDRVPADRLIVSSGNAVCSDCVSLSVIRRWLSTLGSGHRSRRILSAWHPEWQRPPMTAPTTHSPIGA